MMKARDFTEKKFCHSFYLFQWFSQMFTRKALAEGLPPDHQAIKRNLHVCN